MKLFITGATGFVGGHLIKKLIADGNQVTINLRKGKNSPFGEMVPSYCLGHESIENDIKFLNEMDFDGVIHLASLYIKSHQPQNINNLIDSNVKFGSYLLECASQAHIRWFINTGTFWQHYQNADYSPVNLYAATKQAFEDIARYYIETNQIHFCTIKLSDTFGTNDTRSKIFNLWKQIAQTGETLNMSSGNQLIDISYIDDVISAYNILANHLQNKKSIPNGSDFVVKATTRYSLRELADIFQSVTGLKLNINWGMLPHIQREVMIPWQGGTIIPGWKPEYDIEKAIMNVFCQNRKEN